MPPETFKREAVDRVACSGLPIGMVAAELGLNETCFDAGWSGSGIRRRGRRGARLRKRRPHRQLVWSPRMRAFSARATGGGWSATSYKKPRSSSDRPPMRFGVQLKTKPAQIYKKTATCERYSNLCSTGST